MRVLLRRKLLKGMGALAISAPALSVFGCGSGGAKGEGAMAQGSGGGSAADTSLQGSGGAGSRRVPAQTQAHSARAACRPPAAAACLPGAAACQRVPAAQAQVRCKPDRGCRQ